VLVRKEGLDEMKFGNGVRVYKCAAIPTKVDQQEKNTRSAPSDFGKATEKCHFKVNRPSRHAQL